MFTQTDAEKIHETSLVILQDPGIKIEHDYIFNLFLKNGARQGNGTQVVQIPPEMVKDYLALCPKEFDLCGRNGRRHALSAGAPAAVWSCPAMHLYTDGGVRPFTSHDMAEVSRLVDKLDNIQGIFGTAMDDITPAARDVTGLNIMARNTSKHIRAFCFTPAGGRTMAEMKQVVGPEAWFSVGFTAHGPLRWTNLALDIYKETSGYKIPVTVNGEPMAGVSGPVTLAGSGAVGNAEILAGIIAIQLLEAGRPCIYNLGLAHIFDMRTMIAVTGGPENALLAGLSGLMGRFYGIPSGSWVSTESMCPVEFTKLILAQTMVHRCCNQIPGFFQRAFINTCAALRLPIRPFTPEEKVRAEKLILVIFSSVHRFEEAAGNSGFADEIMG